jgi:hypothetical protein
MTLFSNNTVQEIRKLILADRQGLAGKGFRCIGPGRTRWGVA